MGHALEMGSVRRLTVFDQDAFTQHLLRLDDESRYLRFGMVATDAFLLDYAKGCARWDVVIYGYFISGIMRGAAELRPLSADEAEAAFSVETPWRGQGVGSILFEKLIRAARNRSHSRLYMSCLTSNRAMQALARKHAAEITLDSSGTMGIIHPAHRTPDSMSDQAFEDAGAYAFATLDVPSRTPSDPFGWFNTPRLR